MPQTASSSSPPSAGTASHSHYLLHSTLLISTCLLVAGLTVCIIDLDEYSWGLFMVLVAIVGLILCVAFCILGPENQAEPPIAKQLWTRATVKLSGHHPAIIQHGNINRQIRALSFDTRGSTDTQV